MSTSPEHPPSGDWRNKERSPNAPCDVHGCGQPHRRHRRRDRREYKRQWFARTHGKTKRRDAPIAKSKSKPGSNARVIALDGEGFTTKDGRHLYTFLCASTTNEVVGELHDPKGLSTRRILDWILTLPKKPKKVGYALGYDWTKWFEGAPPHVIWWLFRPDREERQGKHGPKPMRASISGRRYSLNIIGNELRIGAAGETRTVLDFFKYFQCAFVPALARWKVGTEEERERIQSMKDQRGSFRDIGEREKEYCRSEVRLLAQLVEKLMDAVDDAGLDVDSWHGPGSLAAAMLKQDAARLLRADATNRDREPPASFTSKQLAKRLKVRTRYSMLYAVQSAFFGGRFEVNRCGPIAPAFSFDIASAYPTAECALPCLAHGRWRHVEGDEREVIAAIRKARAACVHWTLPPHESIPMRDYDARERPADLKALTVVEDDLHHPMMTDAIAYGPFAYRTKHGAILFPAVAPGGWCWHFEFLTALAHPEVWPNVHCTDAWIFESTCSCPPPFRESVARDYARRLEWGKSGRGLVMKTGLNSRYGKRAQTIGSAPFNDLVSAGLITSHTRAAILDAIARAKDPWSVVSIATDGIIVTKSIKLPKPPTTGTERAAREAAKRDGKPTFPLGAWEPKSTPRGVFLIRPGMRFAPDLPDDVGTTAARGLGVRTLHESRRRVLASWKESPRAKLDIQQPPIFHGAKLSVTRRKARPGAEFADDFRKDPKYGRWIPPEPHRVAFDALPKRPGFFSATDHRMLCWALPNEDESAPYDRFVSREFNEDLDEADDVASYQPDGGYDGGVTDGDA